MFGIAKCCLGIDVVLHTVSKPNLNPTSVSWLISKEKAHLPPEFLIVYSIAIACLTAYDLELIVIICSVFILLTQWGYKLWKSKVSHDRISRELNGLVGIWFKCLWCVRSRFLNGDKHVPLSGLFLFIFVLYTPLNCEQYPNDRYIKQHLHGNLCSHIYIIFQTRVINGNPPFHSLCDCVCVEREREIMYNST